jgi:hypothetical protein
LQFGVNEFRLSGSHFEYRYFDNFESCGGNFDRILPGIDSVKPVDTASFVVVERNTLVCSLVSSTVALATAAFDGSTIRPVTVPRLD